MRKLFISIFIFSAVLTLQCLAATYTVTNCADSGPGSLRYELASAEASDEVIFDITTAEAGYSTGEAGPGLVTNEAGSHKWFRIIINSALPTISVANVKVRGSTQTREASNLIGPEVELRADGTFSIFTVDDNGDYATIEGFALNRIGGSDGGSGVYINGGDYCHIYGNYIGTTASGEAVLSDSSVVGVYIFNLSNNNKVGGTGTGEGNVISGNRDYGVSITSSSSGSNSNEVVGNYIGTDRNGQSALGSQTNGVRIQNYTDYNRIGDGTALGRNVISGNNQAGILISGTNAQYNQVLRNYIGTNASGAGALPNDVGISIESGTDSNQIGDGTTNGRNIISGNDTVGIVIDGSGTTSNVVKGNYIGTNFTGTAVLSNDAYGVKISGGAQNNVIGSDTTGEGNVISGNCTSSIQAGILITDSGTSSNEVLGNLIGTDATGASDLTIQGNGVKIENAATYNRVGNATAGGRNVISGNRIGVYIEDNGTDYNSILGNFIGTNIVGTGDLGNSLPGVSVFRGDYNQIGDGTSGGRNIISGNGRQGINFEYSSSNEVYGNFIGTDVTGTADLGNTYSGIAIGPDASFNKIGSSVAGTGNIISGNERWGIYISGSGGYPSNTNEVTGNYIGTDVTATADLGNTYSGVKLEISASFTRIGTGNVIAYNGNVTEPGGVLIVGVQAIKNQITYNLIYGNYTQGIILQGGSNGGIATPEVLSAGLNELTGLIQITGETAPAYGTVEVYQADNGQAIKYLATTIANASGQFTAEVTGLGTTDSVVVTATTTNPSTSEFSLPIAVTTVVTRDAQPDNMIATLESGADYVGEGIYNTDGTNQTRSASISTGSSETYYVKIKNAGNLTFEVNVKGTASTSAWTITYYDAKTGGNDITSQVVGLGWITSALATDETTEIRFVVTSTGTSLSTYEVLVTSNATPDTSALDAVKASTTAIPPTDLTSFDVAAPATAIAGTAFSVTITARDSGGGTETVIVGTTSLEVDDGTISPTSIESSAFSSGIWTGNVTLSKPGSRTITVSNGSAQGTDVVLVGNATQEYDSTDLGIPGMSITIPAGAATSEVTITVTQVNSPADPPPGYYLGGNAYDIVSSPITFLLPITVTIPISGPLAAPRVYYYDGSTWNLSGITIVSFTDTSLTFTTTHCTVFAPMASLSSNLVRFGPNPYDPNSASLAHIWYWLTADAATSIYVVDMKGALIWKNSYASGANGGRAGSNSIDFNGRDRWNNLLGNGVYIYKVVQGGKSIGGGRIAIIKQ